MMNARWIKKKLSLIKWYRWMDGWTDRHTCTKFLFFEKAERMHLKNQEKFL